MEILEEEYEETKVIGVDQDTEDPGGNHPTGANNAVPGNPTGTIPTNNNNTPKMETIDDNSDTEEDETENKEKIQDEGGFEVQVESTSPAEKHVWEESQRHGICPIRKPRFQQKYPSDNYTNHMVHVFTELNLKQGLKRFRNKGIKTTKSEIQKCLTRWYSI